MGKASGMLITAIMDSKWALMKKSGQALGWFRRKLILQASVPVEV
jgi:hypothetical protein